MRTSVSIATLSIAVLAFAHVPVGRAAVQGTVRIDQLSPTTLGSWTLLAADGTTRSSSDEGVNPASYSYSVSEVGQMVFSVVPPTGMSSKISVYRNDELTATLNAQQYEYTLFPNDNYKFLVQYAYTKLGLLGVTSEPSGLSFRVRGPKNFSGKTPASFTNLPAGSYAIYVGNVPGCLKPPPQTAVVTEGGRTAKVIKLTCNVGSETEAVRTKHQSRRSLQNTVEAREAKPRGERK
jgi:hypothetical protein